VGVFLIRKTGRKEIAEGVSNDPAGIAD